MDFHTIPTELIFHILPNLDINSLLSLCNVDTRIHNLCSDQYLWKSLVETQFSSRPPKSFHVSWKHFYISLHLPVYFNGDILGYAHPINFLPGIMSIIGPNTSSNVTLVGQSFTALTSYNIEHSSIVYTHIFNSDLPTKIVIDDSDQSIIKFTDTLSIIQKQHPLIVGRDVSYQNFIRSLLLSSKSYIPIYCYPVSGNFNLVDLRHVSSNKQGLACGRLSIPELINIIKYIDSKMGTSHILDKLNKTKLCQLLKQQLIRIGHYHT